MRSILQRFPVAALLHWNPKFGRCALESNSDLLVVLPLPRNCSAEIRHHVDRIAGQVAAVGRAALSFRHKLPLPLFCAQPLSHPEVNLRQFERTARELNQVRLYADEVLFAASTSLPRARAGRSASYRPRRARCIPGACKASLGDAPYSTLVTDPPTCRATARASHRVPSWASFYPRCRRDCFGS